MGELRYAVPTLFGLEGLCAEELRRLELPEHLTANGMLEALNLLTDREELAELLQDQ